MTLFAVYQGAQRVATSNSIDTARRLARQHSNRRVAEVPTGTTVPDTWHPSLIEVEVEGRPAVEVEGGVEVKVMASDHEPQDAGVRREINDALDRGDVDEARRLVEMYGIQVADELRARLYRTIDEGGT